MKKLFCRFDADGPCWGVVNGRRIDEILPDPFGPYEYTGLSWSLDEVGLLAPCEPTKIIGIGVNYADHAKEFEKPLPKEPLMFLKPPSAVINPEELIRLPRTSKHVEYEGELAVVIGRRAKNVSPANAEKYILGYTIVNDLTARDFQREDGQWSRAKGFDTFAPMGPWIAAGISPKDLKIQTFINGKIRQNSRTKHLVFKVPQLLSYVSKVMTLEPGDVISTGTPAGVGPLKRGDRVEVRIEGIGALRNKVA